MDISQVGGSAACTRVKGLSSLTESAPLESTQCVGGGENRVSISPEALKRAEWVEQLKAMAPIRMEKLGEIARESVALSPRLLAERIFPEL